MSSQKKLQELLDWSKSNGADISPKLDFKVISEGNIGVFYNEKVARDQELQQIQLPLNLIITLQTAVDSFHKEDPATSYPEISQKTSNINSLLKIYLSKARTDSSSFFKPYLTLLPSLYQINSPYTWNTQDKDLLKGTNLGNSLKENLTQLIEEWWQIINLIPDTITKPTDHFINMKFYYEYKFYKPEDFDTYFEEESKKIDNWTSFPNYLWSSLILKSRSFPRYLLKNAKDSESKDIKQDEAMLLPLIDLLNHDPKAKVNWIVDAESDTFNFKSDNPVDGEQLYNNYGMKGNEELLLAYGFALKDNAADSVALKIKIDSQLVDDIEKYGIQLPSIEDYTTSVVRKDSSIATTTNKSYEDGVLYFITNDNLSINLIQIFQYLVKNRWETNGEITLRMQLAGLNHLRSALESKLALIDSKSIPASSANHSNIKIYIDSQVKIYKSTIKRVKHLEKELIGNHKSDLVSLKSVYKKDKKLQQALLVSFGLTSYESILQAQFQDQMWLLYLIRCVNRGEYLSGNDDIDGDEDNYLPQWIEQDFTKLKQEITISNEEVVQYQPIYENLIPELNAKVPEIFNKGDWTIQNFVYSAKLLDIIGFVRGKDQECILVKH
ncbi:hypothetical protein DFJ63DRAFT_219278 [Scheffersomyces coipomensis]|uniref:uncharacterized protein n=1 Tax=Scheffersomyces coipomensis TaxID=1788519 RepID=UPI00315C5E64